MEELLTIAPLPAAHLAKLVLHAGPYAAEVDPIHAVEGFGGLVSEVGGWGLDDAGVVEGHVESAEGSDGGVDHGGDIFFGGDVTGDGRSLVAGRSELVGGYPERVLIDVAEDHGGPGLGEGLRSGQSHAGAGAGD
jgi:hypothetical protein